MIKNYAETIRITKDFKNKLETGETISSCSLSISCLNATDTNKDQMLYQIHVIEGSKVRQKIILGKKGYKYKVTWTINTSLGLVKTANTLIEVV